MIELLQSLIKIKSLSPKDMGCFDLIEKELSELNFNIKRINYQNVENLYASVGSSGKLFCFLGHTDVVPSGPEEKWKYPPFSATIEDDLLYGRGVADMKGSVAAFIEASKDFLSSSEDLNFRLAILLTSNEEGTSKDGFIDKIIENMIQENEIIDYCLVGEPIVLEPPPRSELFPTTTPAEILPSIMAFPNVPALKLTKPSCIIVVPSLRYAPNRTLLASAIRTFFGIT